MSDLPKRLRIKASMIALGERIAWGSDTALMEEAADVIESLIASVENHQLHMLGMARDRDQLRAMLSEQQQASTAQSAPATGIYSSDPLACPGCAKGCFRCMSKPQSAPAGERETIRSVFLRNGFTVKEGQADLKPYVYAAAEELLSIARTAWQRTQSAPVVPEWNEAIAEAGFEALDELGFQVGQSDIGTDDLKTVFYAMLAAAPAQPAAQDQVDQQEGLHVWRATSRLGYTCHFGEASAARAWAGENGTIERVDLTPVHDLQVVERQDQSEVQRLREAAQKVISHVEGDLPIKGWLRDNDASRKALGDLRACLAASTGQEVKP